MSAVAPIFGPRHSETTRLMCASVFLGHDHDIRTKIRTYVTDRFHCPAENFGLDVLLLARVLDFFDQQRLRFLMWHGILGSLCFATFAGILLASADLQPRDILVIFLIAIGFSIPFYVRYLRNHYHYPLHHFARDAFKPLNALQTFENTYRRYERRVAFGEKQINTTVFGGFGPFVGSGDSIGNWALIVDTRKGRDGSTPTPFTLSELEDAIASAFKTIAIPSLEQGERLFVHGTDVTLIEGLLPNRFHRPKQWVNEEVFARYRHIDGHEARIYRYVAVSGWDDQVRLTSFYRVTFRGPMLYIENHSHVLNPLWTGYRAVDNLLPPRMPHKIGLFAGFVLAAPIICVAETISLWRIWADDSKIRRQAQQEKEQIQEHARFNYGAVSSLRESFATPIYDHFFEKSDRDLYAKALQKQLLDGILAFLEEKNIDTSDFREQKTYIINSGLIVHGDVRAEALAVGSKSRAKMESGREPKVKKPAEVAA
jgi:hypothetical protein